MSAIFFCYFNELLDTRVEKPNLKIRFVCKVLQTFYDIFC